MINKIIHCGDIHIKKSLDRHQEYREIFDKFYNELDKIQPDRIVITGDLYDNFLDIEGEALILVGEFLNKLSTYCKVIIIKGNHDYRKRNIYRIDTIETVTILIENENVIYYNKSGFYTDENIIWVVWDHADGLNPWNDIEHIKINDKIYIDLFHDPINGCLLPNGMIMEGKYRKINEFKGDYSLFSDIHLRQFYNKNTKGYSSSMIQQNFGEFVGNHGFNLLDLKVGYLEPFNIENDYKFINLEINENTDYNNIKLSNNIKGDKIKFKIKWEDFSVNMNIENERKIRKFIKENFGSDLIQIENKPIYTDVTESKLLSEILDINDINIQQNLLREFLSLNDIKGNLVDDIIEIDNIINKRLDIKKSRNIKWNIDKLWFNNFKSYGDNNIIDLKNMNGIIQIHGINQQGKSTILDVICYILYGTTLSTQKREKNGDNRFINNKRDLNYCDGGIVIDIDNEKYLIYRKTERKVKKSGEIISCSTVLDYYKGDEINDKNKLVGENRNKTQNDLDEILGDFRDFIRLTLTNADNINDLLSMDRSIFIDNIIKDAGYDIFEKKLNEFKEYKKTLISDRITINIKNIDYEINNILNEINNDTQLIKEYDDKIIIIDNEIIDNQIKKEDLLSKLNKIDDKILQINYDNLNRNINKIDEFIKEQEYKIKTLDKYSLDLPETFDYIDYDNIKSDYNKLKDDINKKQIEIKNIENEIKDLNFNINNNENDIKTFIREIQNQKENYIKEKENNYNLLFNDLKVYKRDIEKLREDISILEVSTKETKICPTCKRSLDDFSHINEEITNKNNNIEILFKEAKNKKSLADNIKIEIEEIRNDYKNDELDNLIKSKNYIINDLNKKIGIKYNDIENINKDISDLKDDIESINTKISIMDINKKGYEERKKIELDIKDIKIIINEKIISNNNDKILLEKYIENRKFIEENIKINFDIKNIESHIQELNDKRKNINNDKLNINRNIILKNKSLDDLKEKIELYKEQERTDFIHNTYIKSMHRDGLPTFLLKKSIHIINNELMNLLSNVDFNLFFDNELNLKMKSKIDENSYNAVEGSGKERTFHACALKMALRKINNISKPEFILYDEIMNKLVDKSVDEFTDFLYNLKNYIDKIILIEHIHQIKYDYLINVEKINSISFLKIF